jgi:hypothetical protein
MLLQKFLTPVVFAFLLISQECPVAFAQQPAAQPAEQASAPPAQQPGQQVLNNDAIIKLVKAGLSDDLIVNTIGTSTGTYDVSPDGMIALKSAGVSDRVVSAMVAKSSAPAPPAPAAAALPAPPPAPATYMLAEGSDVYLAFDQDLSSKTSAVGDPVALILTEDIKVGNVVVAKSGAKALGEITNAEKSEMLGKGGELNMRLDYLKVGALRIHLRGTQGAGGKDSVGGTIGLMILCTICGILHHGKEIKIQRGTALHAYVSDDISLPAAN